MCFKKNQIFINLAAALYASYVCVHTRLNIHKIKKNTNSNNNLLFNVQTTIINCRYKFNVFLFFRFFCFCFSAYYLCCHTSAACITTGRSRHLKLMWHCVITALSSIVVEKVFSFVFFLFLNTHTHTHTHTHHMHTYAFTTVIDGNSYAGLNMFNVYV